MREVFTAGRKGWGVSEIVDLNAYRRVIAPTPAGRSVGVDDLAGARADERLRTVFEFSPLGQIVSDMTGTIVAVNAPMADMLGYHADKMIGLPTRTFVVPRDLPGVVDDADRLASGVAEQTTSERGFCHRDGHEVRVSVTSALLRGDDREPRWWISMVRDITEQERGRRDLERAHAKSVRANARLRTMHAIAVAASTSGGLEQVIASMLSDAVQRSGCIAAAQLTWRTGETAAQVEQQVGDGEPWSSWRAPTGRRIEIRRPGDDRVHVLAPIDSMLDAPGTTRGLGYVLIGEPDPDELELLALFKADMARAGEREASANMLRSSEARFRSIFADSPLPMGLTLGMTGTYSDVNPALCELVGLRLDQLIGQSAAAICHPDDLPLLDPAGAAALAAPDRTHCFELRLRHASGRVVPTMVTLTWMDGPDHQLQLLAQMQDLTDRREAEAALRRQAEQDPLTGTANRVRLNRELAELADVGAPRNALFVDLDGFKLINDTRGHDIGDEVLCSVADLLRCAGGEDYLLARFGGDQFVLLGPIDPAMPCSSEDAREVAERIRDAFTPPVGTANGHAQITASVGIAHGRIDPQRPQGLVERADIAMHEAKRLGRDRYAVSDSALRQRTVARRRTEAALRNALDESRFVVHYQPIVRLDDRSITGFESLVRLVDEHGELVAPTQFIAVAEQSGLIVPMGEWVLRESCRQIAGLRSLLGRPLTVAVNVAARQAARPDFADSVLRVVAEAGLPEAALALELTESALLEANDATLSQLTRLRDNGVRIALDDFGTGYSSLTYLQQFPVSHLKVDRSFVSGMMRDTNDRAIVRAVTNLATDLGLTWVAEGVETIEQHAALADLSPQSTDLPALGQGWLYSRAVPASQLRALFD